MVGAVLLLSSCTLRVQHLPPEQVLERAVRAVQELDSATFAVQAQFQGPQTIGDLFTVNLDGRLQDAGRQLAFTVDATLETSAEQTEPSQANADVVITDDQTVYVRFRELSGTVFEALFGKDVASGTWWQLPSGNDAVSPELTPDPTLLRAQASVITVTKDLGPGSVNGRAVYRYATKIDQQKLHDYLQSSAQEHGQKFDEAQFAADWGDVTMSGTVSIDAKTYFLHSITWDFASVPADDGLTGHLVVELKDHNAAEPIVPPAASTPWVGTLPTL